MASAVMDLTLAMEAQYTEFNVRDDSETSTLIRLYDSATQELERLVHPADSGILLGGFVVGGDSRIEVWDVVPLVHVRLDQALRAGGAQVIGVYECGKVESMLELSAENRAHFAQHFAGEQRLLLKIARQGEGLSAARFYLGIDGKLSSNRVTVDFPVSLSSLMGTPPPAPVAVSAPPAPTVVAPPLAVAPAALIRKPVAVAVAPKAIQPKSANRGWIVPAAVLGVGLGIGLAVWAPRFGSDKPKPPAPAVARQRAPQAAPPTLTIRVEPLAPAASSATAKQGAAPARSEAPPQLESTRKPVVPRPFTLARATPTPSPASIIDVSPPALDSQLPTTAPHLPAGLQSPAPAAPPASIIEQRQVQIGNTTPARPPKAVRLVTPVLNSKARSGVRGEVAVNVAVEIDAAGRVLSAVPINRPMDVLATAAVEAARNSVFEPATAGSLRVPGKLRLQFRFKEEPLRLPVHSTLR